MTSKAEQILPPKHERAVEIGERLSGPDEEISIGLPRDENEIQRLGELVGRHRAMQGLADALRSSMHLIEDDVRNQQSTEFEAGARRRLKEAKSALLTAAPFLEKK